MFGVTTKNHETIVVREFYVHCTLIVRESALRYVNCTLVVR